MANTPQSKKRARQSERRYAVNKARRSRIRTFLRKVEEAIASGDKDAAATALKAAQPELMRGVTKGVVHKNTAARKMSRLSSRVKAIGFRVTQPHISARPGGPFAFPEDQPLGPCGAFLPPARIRFMTVLSQA
jgi:small subunit ribosomal protein S20